MFNKYALIELEAYLICEDQSLVAGSVLHFGRLRNLTHFITKRDGFLESPKGLQDLLRAVSNNLLIKVQVADVLLNGIFGVI